MRTLPFKSNWPGRKVVLFLRSAGGAVLGALSVAPSFGDGPADSPALVRANQEFAVHLYQQLGHADGNLFFSPYSVSSMLALAYAGARGQTATEMATVLGVSASPDELARAYAGLAQKLSAANGAGSKLTVANSVWGQRDFPFRPAFLELGRQSYQAELQSVDFIGDAEEARGKINAWVDRSTQGKITDLIPVGMLSPATRLALCNAVYFKGRWQNPFEKSLTLPGDFHLTPGTAVSIPTMRETARFRIAQATGLRLAELPYAGRTMSMVILLPDALDGLPAVERQLDADRLRDWLAALDKSRALETHLTLPSFTQTWAADLTAPLGKMGLPDAFGPSADFSGISEKGPLFISKVLQKSYVKVDEEGTEAAAATAGIMTFAIARSPPNDFHVDHPFLFLIRENASGTILFVGRIVDPR